MTMTHWMFEKLKIICSCDQFVKDFYIHMILPEFSTGDLFDTPLLIRPRLNAHSNHSTTVFYKDSWKLSVDYDWTLIIYPSTNSDQESRAVRQWLSENTKIGKYIVGYISDTCAKIRLECTDYNENI